MDSVERELMQGQVGGEVWQGKLPWELTAILDAGKRHTDVVPIIIVRASMRITQVCLALALANGIGWLAELILRDAGYNHLTIGNGPVNNDKGV